MASFFSKPRTWFTTHNTKKNKTNLMVRGKKKINRFFVKILNAKITYILIILIILMQLILVSFIFAYYSRLSMGIASIITNVSKISGQQNLLNEKLNSLQSTLGAIQSQIYRLQSQQIKPD